jgi:hypothetical protein
MKPICSYECTMATALLEKVRNIENRNYNFIDLEERIYVLICGI